MQAKSNSTPVLEFNLHTPQGSEHGEDAICGAHNVQNAAAATAFALAIGIELDDIVQGLEQAQGAKGRLNFYSASTSFIY